MCLKYLDGASLKKNKERVSKVNVYIDFFGPRSSLWSGLPPSALVCQKISKIKIVTEFIALLRILVRADLA